ncbi:MULTISPECIES: IspD/TarI family cytidylyltransferase [Ruminococcus]|uniref:4-diphosphocytidyl-2C-methyl-D-erythritol synthase n=1 Tax=Ruminococcus albus (strain ATCC 27210 / DSM 20455 / JCM 14654 / NCDO 2250 / 7) TaxID=697329 RepID=E6UJ13_RUMA7|nr:MULTISPECIES: 2-C-methyl-D-erythritol 4-phosphate cytidylyltransferase [Ruminococcus]ADU22279.1 4-diphosphocytidyl-2C-methyl-D-erythritol synthase [Ruminococcus albus 7 = DSM 20455]MCR5019542.1 2-C-methyl-D-erythritol 4-phosphate cytidylyltransferase [Ruminococcus sp.]
MIFAGIVAGGSGSRIINADKPKQFIEIGGIPILIRTIRAFEDIGEIERIYVGIKPDWYDYADKLLEEYNISSKRVRLVTGGKNRNGTVLNILREITAIFGVNKGDVLITHDAVRPFVSERIIRDNITCALNTAACGTYIPSDDTIIRTKDGLSVTENLPRRELMRAQTPQTFEISTLCDCIDKLGNDKLDLLTDTCGILTECGYQINIVKGEPMNFKITTDHDLMIAGLMAMD